MLKDYSQPEVTSQRGDQREPLPPSLATSEIMLVFTIAHIRQKTNPQGSPVL
jgi:hypothetical protein